MSLAVALTVAGVDSSGGAGVAADLNTFASQGVWGTCAITAVTAQNSLGVDAIEYVSTDVIVAQIGAVCRDMRVGAAKTGMLGSAEVATAVAAALPRGLPLVVDPVMVATTGATLGSPDSFAPLIERATVVTPNAAEVKALTGVVILGEDDMVRAARIVLEGGCDAVLVKGGHVGDGPARDCLIIQGQAGPVWLESERFDTSDTHGTGCVLSAAIAAHLAQGSDIADACWAAKDLIRHALRDRVRLGQGVGAVNPLGALRRQE
ncbi:MAG: bifunctional hydroxymethylpyrimidine kinase/phosphomethylpyrimidine kinase [Acidimicrobiales bacterium]|nr:bifunctional hydroxymethylpyrimidine kinase/phosphomethylpyrimidine kinase [Acidimicrobiales bacterium]